MKILIFEWRDIKNPKAGGSEIYFHELAKRWVKLGNRVEIICGGWKNCIKNEVIDGVNITRVGNPKTLYFLAPYAYLGMKDKPDVIIDVENGIPFFTPLFIKRKKIFLHIHHVHREVWFKQLPLPFAFIGWLMENKIMPFAYKNVPIITLSDSSKQDIQKLGFKQEISIVNPGINFIKFKKFEKNKNPTIFFLNRIKKYKGLDILLKSVSILNNRKVYPEVLIAGGGDDKEIKSDKEYAKSNQLSKTTFLGKISEEKKAELMQKSWLFINPSFKEGWGIVNIEANYFGILVIGSNVSGIKDSIKEGKTGLLFEYGNHLELANKIQKLLKDDKMRKIMGKNAINWANKFDWKIKAKDYLQVIQKKL